MSSPSSLMACQGGEGVTTLLAAPFPIVEYKRIGDCHLYLGDALQILPLLQPRIQITCIVSDMPYALVSGGNTTGEMGGKFSRDRYDNSGSIIPCAVTFDQMMPVLSSVMEQGHAYFMVNNRHVASVQNAAESSGFRFHNLLVWNKITATPNRWYMKNLEFTCFMFKGKARSINDPKSKQLITAPNIINGDHETQKPVPVMEGYIRNSTQPGDTMLDPFMGSGTTGVACARLSRSFVGIEIERRYFDMAVKRIAAAYGQPTFDLDGPST